MYCMEEKVRAYGGGGFSTRALFAEMLKNRRGAERPMAWVCGLLKALLFSASACSLRILCVGFILIGLPFCLSPLGASEVHRGTLPSDTLSMALARVDCGDYEGALRLLGPFTERCDSCREARLLEAQCLLKLNRDLPRVEVLLNYQQETPLVLMLRAEQLRKSYRFEQAVEAYARYAEVADPRLLTASQAFLRQVECQNGQRLCLSAHQPVLVTQTAAPLQELDVAFRELVEKGSDALPPYHYQLIARPRSLQVAGEVAQGVSSGLASGVQLIAYPKELKSGERVFFSARREGEVEPSLYSVSYQGGELWSEPESVGPVVNTGRGCTLAILAEDGKTLYFSSRGHYGMGDYDIFRTVYDSVAEQWSPPVNLGFPFNTPYDDFLVGLPTGIQSLVLASNRGISPDSLRLFLLQCDLRRPGISISSATEMAARADFSHAGVGKASADEVRNRAKVTTARQNSAMKYSGARPNFREVEGDPEYQKALAKGFQIQSRVDTIRDILTPLKEKMDEATTPGERKSLESRVIVLEKEMLSLQRQADKYFVQASNIEREYVTGKRTLLHGQKGEAQFAQDRIEHLYQSQLAPTVFQRDELDSLGVVAERRQAFLQEDAAFHTLELEVFRLMQDTTISLAELVQAEERAELAARDLVAKYDSGLLLMRTIYTQCLPVALVKNRMRNASLVKAAEKKAKECYFKARSILGAAEEKTAGQSGCTAMLLTLLGNDYLELGFTYAWGLDDYRVKVTQRVEQLQARLGLGQKIESVEGGGNDPAPKPKERPKTEQTVTPPERDGVPQPGQMPPGVAGDGQLQGLQITTPNPYSAERPVPYDVPLPSGVVYRWQLGAYSNPIDPALFRGLNPVFAERVDGGRITKYYAGDFRGIEEARLGKTAVQQCGFPDAFLVAWYNGSTISLGRAEALEGVKGEGNPTPTSGGARVEKENPALVYRVLVGHFGEKLPERISATISLLAPGKDVVRTADGEAGWSYTLGDFNSKRDAERVRDNLLASGLMEAKLLE